MKVTKIMNADRVSGYTQAQGNNWSQNAIYAVYSEVDGTEIGQIRAITVGARQANSGAWQIFDTYHWRKGTQGLRAVKAFHGANAFKRAKEWARDDGNWFETWVRTGDLKLELEPSQELIDAVTKS